MQKLKRMLLTHPLSLSLSFSLPYAHCSSLFLIKYLHVSCRGTKTKMCPPPSPRKKNAIMSYISVLPRTVISLYTIQKLFSSYPARRKGDGGRQRRPTHSSFSPARTPPKSTKLIKKNELLGPVVKPLALFFSLRFLITALVPTSPPKTSSPPKQPLFHHLYYPGIPLRDPLR